MELDRFDIRLLTVVQERGDLTLEELAERVMLSPSQCSRRLQTLRSEGYIRGVATLLDPARLGLGIKAFVMVVLRQHGERSDAFHDLIRRSAEVLECNMITGDADFLLKLCTKDLKSFRAFIEELAATKQVANIRSSIVVDETKNTSALPVELALKKEPETTRSRTRR
jgi:Lrp/AsnC family transcriptional regulator, leucine-responsive regulatory protein